MLPSYRNQSFDFSPANQLTGFYIRGTLAFNGLRRETFLQKQPPEVFYEKVVPRNFTKFTEKHRCHSLFFNKVADLRPATLLKKRLWHRCFPEKFAKFLRTPFIRNTTGRLLLECIQCL